MNVTIQVPMMNGSIKGDPFIGDSYPIIDDLGPYRAGRLINILRFPTFNLALLVVNVV